MESLENKKRTFLSSDLHPSKFSEILLESEYDQGAMDYAFVLIPWIDWHAVINKKSIHLGATSTAVSGICHAAMLNIKGHFPSDDDYFIASDIFDLLSLSEGSEEDASAGVKSILLSCLLSKSGANDTELLEEIACYWLFWLSLMRRDIDRDECLRVVALMIVSMCMKPRRMQ